LVNSKTFRWMLGWLALPAVLFAQEQPVRPIVSVVFIGLDRTEESFARDVAQITVGEPYDPQKLDEAVARLLRTGRFIGATHSVRDEQGGAVVTIEVRERSIVKSVSFEGNKKFSDKKLTAEVGVKVGGGINQLAISAGRDAIREKYQTAGHTDVAVGYDQSLLERTGELVYRIEEGKRVRIRKIAFEGNSFFSADQLKRYVQTKKAFWILRSGAFDKERIETDVVQLQSYCRDEGFLDARVSYRTELNADGTDMTVIFTIDEGTRYTIESIEFQGHATMSRESLLGLMKSKVGATALRPQIDSDARAIQVRYGENGHIYATVRAIRVFSNQPGLVRLTIQIEEGEQYRVGRVLVRGNKRTKDKVVRRALNLYPPDDLFNLKETREAEQRLLESRIFSSARIYPVGDAANVRDIMIDVQEAEKAGDFVFGAGITSNNGIIGNVVLDLQNFDLYDPPRNWTELRKFRAFFGGGQRLRLELQPGTELSRFRIDFTEPYLFDKPLRFNTSLYLFERGRDSYDESRGGGSVSFGKQFESGRWSGWSGEIGLRVEDVTIDDLDVFASRIIRDDEGSNLITSLRVSGQRDRTDSRTAPSSGNTLRFGVEQFGILGGDHAFTKLTAGCSWYKTIKTDRLDRKSVLKLRCEGGVILGDAPVFERFYGGGTGSIRGFEFRGVGPRHGIEEDNIGGEYTALWSGEYAFPLFGQNLRGLVFLDSGVVGSGPVRASIGTGVRFTIHLGRPIPLEINLAFPFLSDSEDEEQAFSFQIGSLF